MLSTVSLTALSVLFASATPELLVMPPKPDGIPEIQAIQAWETITQEFNKQKGSLKISTSLQSSAQGILLGMGKKTSWNCGFRVKCLANLGEDLDAQYLVAGKISDENMTMIIVDVRQKKRLLRVRTGKKVSKKTFDEKIKLIAKALARGFKRKTQAPTTRKAIAKKKRRKSKKTSASTAKKAEIVAKPEIKKPTLQPSELAAQTTAEKEVQTNSAPAPEIKITEQLGSLDGLVRFRPGVLTNVTSVTVDGQSIAVREDGSAVWIGPAGLHNLVVKRNDGFVARAEFTLDPRQQFEPKLTWEEDLAAIPMQDFESYREKKENWQQWWFWASIGGALIAGSVTAGLLLDGDVLSGGPDVAGPTGTVSGTY
ncbi:MAG: hypothetical protein VYC39_05070 [Myxococcota bacterium]|nr:hypothetical protein [Myxococcota bacterium]